MSGFLAVFRREFAERRLLLLAALAAGVFALAVPLLPGAGGRDASEVRTGGALALALIVAAVLALVLGASVIAGDLAERRLGFYFSRPIPGWAVWAGKLAGVAALAVSAAMLVLLPSLLLGGRVDVGTPWLMGSSWPRGLAGSCLLLAGGTVGVLVLSHVASSMVRSRSAWLLLDLAAASVLAALIWSCWQALWSVGAGVAVVRGFGGLAASLIVAGSAAGAIQVTRGRTDPRRGHRLLSLTFWTGMGLAGLAFAAYTRWVVNPAPEDLVAVEQVLSAPRGDWIALRGFVGGRRGAYATGFLFDTASGRWLPLNTRFYYRPWLAFSEDGRRAAWLEGGQGGGYDLKTLDLTRPGARPAAPPVSFRDMPRELVLSPDGSRFAVVQEDGALIVEELATGRLLAADSIPGAVEGSVDLRFAGPDHLRILELIDQPAAGTEGVRHQLLSCELRIPRGRIAVTARTDLAGGARFASLSYEAERAVVFDWSAHRLVDLQSGTILPGPDVGFGSAFLMDGRIVAIRKAGDQAELGLFSRDGEPLRQFRFRASHLLVGGEIAPGVVVLAASSGPWGQAPDWTSLVLDVSTGRVTTVGRGLLPGRLVGLWTHQQAEALARGAGARVFLRTRRQGDAPELVLLEPSGRLRKLFGARRGDGP